MSYQAMSVHEPEFDAISPQIQPDYGDLPRAVGQFIDRRIKEGKLAQPQLDRFFELKQIYPNCLNYFLLLYMAESGKNHDETAAAITGAAYKKSSDGEAVRRDGIFHQRAAFEGASITNTIFFLQGSYNQPEDCGPFRDFPRAVIHLLDGYFGKNSVFSTAFRWNEPRVSAPVPTYQELMAIYEKLYGDDARSQERFAPPVNASAAPRM